MLHHLTTFLRNLQQIIFLKTNVAERPLGSFFEIVLPRPLISIQWLQRLSNTWFCLSQFLVNLQKVQKIQTYLETKNTLIWIKEPTDSLEFGQTLKIFRSSLLTSPSAFILLKFWRFFRRTRVQLRNQKFGETWTKVKKVPKNCQHLLINKDKLKLTTKTLNLTWTKKKKQWVDF